ncbi:MAG: UDP-N-acetylmuramate--L-alanine ligase [Candidatus Paceibacterota bacterium]|jgi:UDP-N-acetylmuramate--alanine ligase
MKKSLFDTAKNVHFIGIGGIGISAIAKMFLLEGKNISGSDMSDSEIISELSKSGAKINIGHSSIPKETDLVIYTIAITEENPEFVEAKNRGLQMITYPQALHEISKDKYTIAISGTHGKTTTTAMIAKIMMDADLDPTVIVGSILKDAKSNFVAGKSKYLVVEACEYRKSFLNIEPTIAVITNIDNDHLDFYKDIHDIQNAFGEFITKVPKGGFVVCNPQDKMVKPAIKEIFSKIVDAYEFRNEKLKLKVLGEHNKKNSDMALAVAHLLGIPKNKAKKSLEDFSGTWRRFEYKGETKSGAIVYDDYGHHPTEIKASLKGAREMFPKQKIVVVFQPHLFSRTKLLLNDFSKSFNDADKVILAPIYPAREPFDSTISSEILAEKIGEKAESLKDFISIEKYLVDSLSKGDILITMGAGDVYKTGEEIIK